MPLPPYPLLPRPIERSWIERHPLCKIPLGCLTLVLLMAFFGMGVLLIVTVSFRSSDVYNQAMVKARANAQVRQELGEPIKAGWFIAGQLNVSGSTGNADFSIPIKGPRDRGRIRVVAHKNQVWRFTCLQVYVEGPARWIDLLSVEPSNDRESEGATKCIPDAILPASA